MTIFQTKFSPIIILQESELFFQDTASLPPHTQKSRGMWLPSHTEVKELILRPLFILPVTLAEDEQTYAHFSLPFHAGAATNSEWSWLYSSFSLILYFQENDTLEAMGHFQSVTTTQDLCLSPTHSQLYKKTQQKKVNCSFIVCLIFNKKLLEKSCCVLKDLKINSPE